MLDFFYSIDKKTGNKRNLGGGRGGGGKKTEF